MKNKDTAISKSSAKSKKPISKVERGNKVTRYLRELKSEFKKIVWPSKQQVLNNTGIVIVVMIVTGLFIWGWDSLLALIIRGVFKI